MTREELVAYVEYLEKEVGIDALTGVANRRAFEDKLEHALATTQAGDTERRDGTPTARLALVMIDLDYFKDVNDTFGHPAGDEVLRQVASALAHSIRDTDVVARYGGEEFALILRGADAPAAVKKADEIRRRIAALTFKKHPGLHLTASFGVATTDDATDRDTIVSFADAALYEAKNSGRDNVVMYTSL